MLHKTTLREIKKSLGRYLAILAIIALGVGFFSGLKVTKTAMVDTADSYISGKVFFDFNLLSTLGFTDKDVEYFNQMPIVDNAEGSKSQDMLIASSNDNSYTVIFHQLLDKVNHVELTAGKLPTKVNECLVDSRGYSKEDLGKKLVLSQDNSKDNLEKFNTKEFTIVGIGKSPNYLNFERGNTSLGNGAIQSFVYVPKNSMNEDFYTEIFLTINKKGEIYSQEYDDEIDKSELILDEALKKRANIRYNSIYTNALKDYQEGLKEYEKNYDKYLEKKSSTNSDLAKAFIKIEDGKKSIKNGFSKLEKENEVLNNSKADLELKEKELIAQEAEFNQNKPFMTDDQIIQTEAALASHKRELNDGFSQISNGIKKIDKSRIELLEKSKELKEKENKYYEGKTKAKREFHDAKEKLISAKKDLDKAKADIDDIQKPSTYLLTRESNVGYACFQNDSNIVDGIAKVFPVFFFLIAALVCMTTMSRMVDEQRTQIGVLKALGYSAPSIMSKYLIYSGSAATIGAIIGYFSGIYIFPQVIWNAYSIMYDFTSGVHYVFDWKLGVISLTAALVCSMGATYISCRSELKEVPAELIRPKSPKNGKRILLEYITPLWNKISFLYKVTFRNIFRYKKRFFMMVLGISGCTALLVTGFGVKDSIKNIVDFQFDEIQTFDYSIILKDNFTETDKLDFENIVTSNQDNLLLINEQNLDIKVGKSTKSMKVISLPEGNNSKKFLNFHLNNRQVPSPKDGEMVINEKNAKEYNLSVGDTVTVLNSDMKKMKVKISGICENYIYNYAYTTFNTLEKGYNTNVPINTAFIIAHDDNEKSIKAATATLLKKNYVAGASINYELKNRVSQMMNSLDYVVLLIIICAGALAFIVLYNLTNINITERIREIATIKVLGFYPHETSAYVFRENLILTGISALVGLLLGKALHAFVMTEIRVDLLTFDIRISLVSYLLSIVMTFIFAALVNLVMYYKLKHISMTESLKSIE